MSDTVKLGLITEHVIHSQLTAHFHLHDLFHGNHHGSLASHDTATALIQANTFCLEAAEAKKLAATLLVDQTAAFDLLDHSLLLSKLEVYGCTSTTKSWFTSYLANRSFRVQVGSASSNKVEMGPYGVPQGSVLGSTVYVIGVNDLPAASPESVDGQTIAYVDDSSDQVAATSSSELMVKMQTRADNIATWLKDNRMIISPAKTKLIITANLQLRNARAPDTEFSVMLDGIKISATPSERLLGITVSENMSWLPHFWGECWRIKDNQTGLIPDLLRRLGLLKYLARVSSKHHMKSLVPGMFTSKLRYGLQLTSSIWGLSSYGEHELNKLSCPRGTMIKLQTAQRQAAILLCPDMALDYMTPTSLILQEANLLSVHQLAAQSIITLALRIMRTGRPKYLADRLKFIDSRSRSSQLLAVPNLRLSQSHEGFVNQATRLVNKLPPDIISASGPRQKTLLRAWVSYHIKHKP